MNIVRSYYKKIGYEGKYLDVRMNELKIQVKISLIIIFIILPLFILFNYFYIMKGVSNVSNTPFLNIIESYMKTTSHIYENDNITSNIAIVCSEFYDEYDKIRCVRNFFSEFYIYEDYGLPVQTPKELINEGGVCRDASIFYKSIFNLMGFDSEFVFEPNHVYLKVYGKENNYILDQQAKIVID